MSIKPSKNKILKIGLDISITHLNNAGMGIYVRNLVNGLDSIEHDFELTYYDVRQTRGDNKPKNIKTKLDTIYRDLIWMNTLLLYMVKKNKLDLLHMPAYLAPYNKPCPQVLTIGDLIWYDCPQYFPIWQRNYMRIFVPRLAKQSEKIIVFSENTRLDVNKRFGIPLQKIKVVYLAASKIFQKKTREEINQVRQKYQINTPSYILNVGTLEPRKNLERLFQAFSQLRSKDPNIRLIIVSSATWMNSTMMGTINKYELQDSIHLLWKIPSEDLAALYSGALFSIYPSLYEGFGLPVIESMACECPVITSNTSSLPEVAGEAALMVDPYDIGQIALAMETLSQDKALRHNLTQKGLDQARYFSWEKCARETMSVYHEVLGS